jgi:6-phosphogluconolactonase
MRVDVVADHQLGIHGAAYVAAALRAGVAARGRATVAFSGGSAAAPLLNALAEEEVPWSSVHVLQVDERVAPDGHADRNVAVLHDCLVDRVAIPGNHVHEMRVTDAPLERAAERYAYTVERLAGRPPTLDVVHLGIGHDGHTASLVPGTDLLHHAAGSVAVTPPYRGRRRMTLTGPALSAARHVLWVVSGASKAAIVQRFIDSDPALPAVHVSRSRALLLLDAAAAASLLHDTDVSENA